MFATWHSVECDKISREDILAHPYAQCRSNKGAPGVDGQDFADIEAYGIQRWLGELALALREETYRLDPIRRVYIPKADQYGFDPGVSGQRPVVVSVVEGECLALPPRPAPTPDTIVRIGRSVAIGGITVVIWVAIPVVIGGIAVVIWVAIPVAIVGIAAIIVRIAIPVAVSIAQSEGSASDRPRPDGAPGGAAGDARDAERRQRTTDTGLSLRHPIRGGHRCPKAIANRESTHADKCGDD
jgi:hypothetical protein